MNDVQYYLELPYTTFLRRDEDGDIIAKVAELPGCSAHGKTDAEALASLAEAKELWIKDCLESGDPVPEPFDDKELPSGKWVQRVPRSLHKKLVDRAKRENVSLNQLITSILAEAIGTRDRIDIMATAVHATRPHLHSAWAKFPAMDVYDLMPTSEKFVIIQLKSDQHKKLRQNRKNFRDAVGLIGSRIPNRLEMKVTNYGEEKTKHEHRTR